MSGGCLPLPPPTQSFGEPGARVPCTAASPATCPPTLHPPPRPLHLFFFHLFSPTYTSAAPRCNQLSRVMRYEVSPQCFAPLPSHPPLSDSPTKTSPIGHFCLRNDSWRKSLPRTERDRTKVENVQILTSAHKFTSIPSFKTFVLFSGKFPAHYVDGQIMQLKNV